MKKQLIASSPGVDFSKMTVGSMDTSQITASGGEGLPMNNISEETAQALITLFESGTKSIAEIEVISEELLKRTFINSIGIDRLEKIESYFKFSFKYPLNRIKFVLFNRSALEEMREIMSDMESAIAKVKEL